MAAAVSVGMIAWSAVSVSAIGVPWWRFVLAALVTGFVCWSFGGVLQLWLGMKGNERSAPLPRVAFGFAVAAGLIPLLAELRIGPGPIALLIVILSLASCALLWRRRPKLVPMSTFNAFDWMALAVITRVSVSGSQFVSVGTSTTRLTQYWDLTYHLARVKEGLFRGLPLVQDPVLAGAPRPAYHPAFEDYAVVLIKGLGLPVDAGFYGVALPLLGVAFAVALMALTAYATGSRWAPYSTLAVLAMFCASALVPSPLSAYARVYDIAYSSYNPPAAMGTVAAALSIALFSRAFSNLDRRLLLASAILAGATVSMKANTALALGPAFACAAVVLALRRRDVSLVIAPAVTALGAALLWYWPTRGVSAQRAIDPGAFSRWAGTQSWNPAIDPIGRVTERLGLFGDLLFLTVLTLGVLLAWRAVPAAFALVRRPKLPHAVREDMAAGANVYLIGLIVWAAIVGFTIVEVNVGRYSAWNIAGHTLWNVVWIGIVLGGIGLYRVVRPLVGPTPPSWLVAVAVVILVASTPLAIRSVETIRQVGTSQIATPLYDLLQRVPEYAGANAAVAQRFDTHDSWVSGVAGRPAVLERAEEARAYFPAEAERRTELLNNLYAATSPAAAQEAARALGVRYAIVGPNDPQALLEAGSERVRVGDWALIEFPQ